jgi:hypothetical protein
MFDLNELISANFDFRFTKTFVINDRGEIGGIGTPPGCDFDEDCGHALTLIPCSPEDKGSDCEQPIASAPASDSVDPTIGRLPVGTVPVGRDFAAWLQTRFGQKHRLGIPPLK